MQTTVTYAIEVAGLMDRAWEDWLEAPRIVAAMQDGQPVTEERLHEYREQLGLNAPFHERSARWLGAALA